MLGDYTLIVVCVSWVLVYMTMEIVIVVLVYMTIEMGSWDECGERWVEF
jgi:hypothetical protein